VRIASADGTHLEDRAVGEIEVAGPSVIDGIVHGRNISPAQIEATVEPIVGNGIALGVAAFGVPDPKSKTEALHLLIESDVVPRPDQAEMEARVRSVLESAFGLAGVEIHWVSKRRIPKTSSGKIQRFRCRELVEATLNG
jgi:fatty-acyl-CoA synthase